MDRVMVLLALAGWAGLSTAAVFAESVGTGLAVTSLHASDGQDGDADQAEDDEMMAQVMILAIGRDAARMYADLMDLDDTQREIAMDMHREYMANYRSAATAMRDAMEKMEEAFFEEDQEKAAAMMRDLGKVVMGFYQRTVTLADRYVEDLGALAFDGAQQEAHERVVRARVRHEALALLSSNGSGEVIDLLALSQRLEEPLDLNAGEDEGAEAARALLDYERELHANCQRVIEKFIESIKVQFDAMSSMDDEAGWEASMEIESQLEKMSGQLEEITDRYSRRVQQSLSPELAGQWERAVLEARYPQVYAKGDFERTLDVVLGLDDLTQDQRASIDAARDAWRREVETANARWVSAIDEYQRLTRSWPESEDPEVMSKHWEDYQKADEENTAAAEARSELDERFIDRVRKILTPAQQAKLPKEEGGVDVDEVLRQMGGG